MAKATENGGGVGGAGKLRGGGAGEKWKDLDEKGRITPNGVVPEKHEVSTLVFFTDLGAQVELIPTAGDFSMKTPDFMMGGLAWEMKSPAGESHTTIEHIFRRAAHQSQNIIIDLRRTEIPDATAIRTLKERLGQSGRVKRVKVITKTGELVEMEKGEE